LIEAPNGVKVPLSQLATVEEIVGPRQIIRENSQRFITIQANVVGRDIGSFVVDGQKASEEYTVDIAEYSSGPGWWCCWVKDFPGSKILKY
jgi:Cu/Ag efflux pump CusA